MFSWQLASTFFLPKDFPLLKQKDVLNKPTWRKRYRGRREKGRRIEGRGIWRRERGRRREGGM
jgi:hypothetical protein